MGRRFEKESELFFLLISYHERTLRKGEPPFTSVHFGANPLRRLGFRRNLQNNKKALKGIFIILVTPAGVEPAIFWMRTRRPGPLDEGATTLIISQNRLIFNTTIGRHRCHKSLTRCQGYLSAALVKEFYLLSL